MAAETPLRMPLTHSFDQRSPQRLVVDLARCRSVRIMSPSSSIRGVMRPCTSPTAVDLVAGRRPWRRCGGPCPARKARPPSSAAIDADRAAPADDAGDALLVDAVLQADTT